MHVNPASPVPPGLSPVKPAAGSEQHHHPAPKPEEPAPPIRPTLQDRIDVVRRLLDLKQV